MVSAHNDPLKVLQLGTSGPLYGAERWILALSRRLDPALIESHIAVIVDEPDKPVPLLNEAAQLGMRCHSIAAPGRFNPQAISALRQLIRDEGIHVIHSHGYKADIITLLAVRGTDARTVATRMAGAATQAGPCAFTNGLIGRASAFSTPWRLCHQS